MKKHFNLIALYFFALILNAQSQYLPLIEDGKEWNYRIDYGNNTYTDSMSVIGDSIIDGHLYKKVINVWASMDSLLLLREDTAARQVYFLLDSIEYILYDFSLELGDSVTIYTTLPGNGDLNFSPFQTTVSLVDTIVDLNNIHRKRLWLNTQTASSFLIAGPWIEGIGGETGFVPISNNISINLTPNLLCAWNDGVQIYANDNYDSCYYRLVSVETFSKDISNLKTYPNPTKDFINVSVTVENVKPHTVVIRDLQGKILREQPLLNNGTEQMAGLELQALPNGMYLLEIRSDGRVEATAKVIKE
ncbi:MAG: T9SS type A sorting domain-containing protein [Cryomorphaceae bacterium]|nr:T9SS type A sorting domain-containing protein [Cryomorphaceae bacterium]